MSSLDHFKRDLKRFDTVKFSCFFICSWGGGISLPNGLNILNINKLRKMIKFLVQDGCNYA